jgi:hypothetical protein
LLVEIRIAIQGVDCACVLPSRLILFDLTFSLVPGRLLLLASVTLKYLISFSVLRATNAI